MNKENRTVDVFLDKQAVYKINALIHRDPTVECGGFFVGTISGDTITGHMTVHIKDLYYEADRVGTDSSFAFTTDYQMAAFKWARKHCPDYHIIGNIHSHGHHQAFWSNTDRNMMAQIRENAFYMVVSPKWGTYEMLFKDMDFGFHPCSLHIADDSDTEQIFGKTVEQKDESFHRPDGRPCKKVTFRTGRACTDAQRAELDKRFLHSAQTLAEKRVLIVGAGNIGNLLCEYLMHSGVGHLTVVDLDSYQLWNLPRSSMVDDRSVGKSKALALAKAVAEKAFFPIEVIGIHSDICNLGWTFLRGFDLVISPVDSAAIRQYVDRGCKLWGIPHLTAGTGTIGTGFMGNVVWFPARAAVDLEYVWGSGWRTDMEKRRSCSDLSADTQPQVMSFSAQIAGLAADLAIRHLCGNMEDDRTVYKYLLRAVGNGYVQDNAALRVFKYGRLPDGAASELYDIFKPNETVVHRVCFDRTQPKHLLWEALENLFGEEIPCYWLDLEWSMCFPLAYHTTHAASAIAIAADAGVDELLTQLPDSHIYLVRGEQKDYLVRLEFTDDERQKEGA
ncbi:MAG: ThiF family adenylyltransferase [Clostridia bacterium]|nr:ThiF family adenylyltransferase [Clostridia bacterium]